MDHRASDHPVAELKQFTTFKLQNVLFSYIKFENKKVEL